MFPEVMIAPMREELTRYGVEELRTAEAVEQSLRQPGTTMVIVNSVCGCAAGRMRPAVRKAMQHPNRPDRIVTVFAGQDKEATEKAREFFTGYPPSSPSIGILRDGQLVHMMERGNIETREPQEITQELVQAFDRLCAQ
jgi:putative YphP/YqiW family bacilliredoxin